jgi:glycopeptide antibiotics resistance protein
MGIRVFPILHFPHFAQGALHHNLVLDLKCRYGKITSLHDWQDLKAVFLDVDFGGNILLFMPFPFCIYQIFGVNKFWKLLLIGVLSSVAVEFIQYTFSIGVADINDVLTNSIGVLIGILILYAGEML